MKFYYANGSEFEGSWDEAPGWGLQVITWDKKIRHNHPIVEGNDFYILRNGEPVSIDYNTLLYYLVEELRLVKIGSMISSEEWKIIYRKANEERFE